MLSLQTGDLTLQIALLCRELLWTYLPLQGVCPSYTVYPGNVEAICKLANVRIHVQRIIGAVRQHFQILSATGVLSKEFMSKNSDGTIVLDSIVRVYCALSNLCECIVPFD